MNLPLNGRIAIIDNQIEEALPLMRVFSKKQMPYVFYKGDDLDFLPEPNSRFNDIRLLFLDINLLNNKTPSEKDVKSTLYGVLTKVISENNYPYTLIYWSKQEDVYGKLVTELFNKELKDRAPISIHPFKKSDFFNLDGEPTANDLDLIQEITTVLSNEPAYSYLLNWENKIHQAADKTLHEIFNPFTQANWSNDTNHLMTKLGVSFSGKAYASKNAAEKLKSTFNTLNIILNDTVETFINNNAVQDAIELTSNFNPENSNSHLINKKLLLSDEIHPVDYPGTVLKDTSNKKHFENIILSEIIDLKTLDKAVGASGDTTDKVLSKLRKAKRAEMRTGMKGIWFVVTPLCDYVQDKAGFKKVVHGVALKKDFAYLLDTKSEAFFISPPFKLEEESYVLVLNFRYLHTMNEIDPNEHLKPVFRARQQLLAEVQSKLARHLSRQGILFLSDI